MKKRNNTFRFINLSVLLFLFMAFIYACTAPLHRAILKGDVERAKVLIDKNRDNINKVSRNKTSLMLAAEKGQEEIIESLLDAGADVNARNRDGYTPLIAAAAQGHLKIVKRFIEKGAEINLKTNFGSTPLLVAAENNHREIEKLLIDEGADINVKDMEGWSSLMFAAKNGDMEVAELLIEKGADLNARMVSPYLDDEQDFSEDTPLHIAIYFGNRDIVFLLVQNGANVNAKNRSLQTPLYYAGDIENIELAEYLIDSGAKTFILEETADEVYTTAKIHKLVAFNFEKSGDKEKAIEYFTIAADYFEKAVPMLLKESKKYRSKKTLAKVSNILRVIGIVFEIVAALDGDYIGPSVDADMIPSSEIKKIKDLQKEYADKSKESHKSEIECRNILQYLTKE